MRIRRSILFAALVLASGNVLATDGHKGAQAGDMMGCRMMHDSKMTSEEQHKHADTMFRKLDADGDGTITRAEFDRYHDAMMKERMPGDEGGKEHDHSEQQK